jgi:hypothetical protein
VGRAGLRPENRFNTGIEPAAASHQTTPRRAFPPPGIWHFYTYWPEMRSWQSESGEGTIFYGNNFEPEQPFVAKRGEWVCVEVMVRMNSSPEAVDGEQAFWIDGKLAARFGPATVSGAWTRDIFRISADKQPFRGFRWRTGPNVNINKLWLSHYVSERAFERTARYAASNPSAGVNTGENTVWFDDIVVSTEYIGPLQPR